jgi:hypothetical protein
LNKVHQREQDERREQDHRESFQPAAATCLEERHTCQGAADTASNGQCDETTSAEARHGPTGCSTGECRIRSASLARAGRATCRVRIPCTRRAPLLGCKTSNLKSSFVRFPEDSATGRRGAAGGVHGARTGSVRMEARPARAPARLSEKHMEERPLQVATNHYNRADVQLRGARRTPGLSLRRPGCASDPTRSRSAPSRTQGRRLRGAKRPDRRALSQPERSPTSGRERRTDSRQAI